MAGVAALRGAAQAVRSRRDQGVQRCPKGPVSFGMAVMAAKPSGASGARLWRAGEGARREPSGEYGPKVQELRAT